MYVYVVMKSESDDLAHEGYPSGEIVKVFGTREQAVAYVKSEYPKFKHIGETYIYGDFNPEHWELVDRNNFETTTITIEEHEIL